LLTGLPVSRRLLGQVQKTIVNGTRDDSPEAGDLRTTLVCVGTRGARECEVEQARFVPPPPGPILEEGMSAWEKWVNSDNHVPIIAKMTLAHYQFETLHPYNNGNGRLGRLIAILQLIEEKVLRWPLINVSPYLDEHRDEYIEELYNISLSGDFNPWVSFFSAAILDQADKGVRTIQELLEFKDVTLADLRRASVRNAAALELVESLIGYPMIDVPTASRMLGKPFQTANRAVAKLVEFGILREITGRNMGRLFACSEVLRITSGRTRARVR
jgi:Fic family protein